MSCNDFDISACGLTRLYREILIYQNYLFDRLPDNWSFKSKHVGLKPIIPSRVSILRKSSRLLIRIFKYFPLYEGVPYPIVGCVYIHICVYQCVLSSATIVATVMPDRKPGPEKVAEVEDRHQSNQNHFLLLSYFSGHPGRNFWMRSWRMSTSMGGWKWWKNSRTRARRPVYLCHCVVGNCMNSFGIRIIYIVWNNFVCHLEVKGFPFLDRPGSRLSEKQAAYMKVMAVFNFPEKMLANSTINVKINFEGNRDWQQHGDHVCLLEQLCCFLANSERSAGTVVTSGC